MTIVVENEHQTEGAQLIIKKQKLIDFANSVMNDEKFSSQFNFILSSLELKKSDIIQSFLEYNLDIYSPEGNVIYGSLANRVVLHIHNLLSGSWHIERQKVIQEMIEIANPNSIADIGFGVPCGYVKNMAIQEKRVTLTLCDLFDSAFIFARILLGLWGENWSENVKFLKTNMDTHDFVGKFDLYIFQDSIEHTHYPALYLSKYVKLSDTSSKFLISLPIGPIIPRHFIAWETVDEAIIWLEQCGLTVDSYKLVYVNPDVDLFADKLGERYCNLIILCSKIFLVNS